MKLRLPTPPSTAEARRALPWRALAGQALALWLATRVAFVVLTCLYPLATGPALALNHPMSLSDLLARWSHWDGAYYLDIAQHGYRSAPTAAFFPLYPLSIRAVAVVTGQNWPLAGLLASNLAALLACGSLVALAAQLAPHGEERASAQGALYAFLSYPLAFFLTAAYSDGLFMGLATLALTLGLRRRWGWAALAGLLAGACRPTGPALALALAWEALQVYRGQRQAGRTRGQALGGGVPALGAALSPLVGLALYAGYLWTRFGSPLTFLHAAQSGWPHITLFPLITIPAAIYGVFRVAPLSTLQLRILLDVAPVVVALILALAAARRLPLACTLYVAGLLVIITSEPTNYADMLVSGGRYMLAASPLFCALGMQLRRAGWLAPVVYWTGIVAQTALAFGFLGHLAIL